MIYKRTIPSGCATICMQRKRDHCVGVCAGICIGYTSGMSRVCIRYASGYGSSDHPFCRTGRGGFGAHPSIKEHLWTSGEACLASAITLVTLVSDMRPEIEVAAPEIVRENLVDIHLE